MISVTPKIEGVRVSGTHRAFRYALALQEGSIETPHFLIWHLLQNIYVHNSNPQ